MKILIPTIATVTVISALTLASTSRAAVDGLNEGDTIGKSEVEIITAIEALGAKVEEVETEDGMIEVEFTLDGKTYEVEVNEKTGVIAEVELDDDDDHDDDSDEDRDAS